MGRTLLIFTLGVFLLSCESTTDFYLVGTSDQKAQISELFTLLDNSESETDRLIVLEQLSSAFLAAGHPDRMRVFLTTHVEQNPHDFFNAYYLLLVAKNHRDAGETEAAKMYFERLLFNYPDVTVRGVPVHFTALRELIPITRDPERRLAYYIDILDRFETRIDVGFTQYAMARTYEELGRWEESFVAYREFLKHPQSRIPGFPDAHEVIRDRIAFHDSTKNWTFESLEDLVAAIRNALWTQNPRRLIPLQAQENFFAMSWQQEETDFNARMNFDLSSFLIRSNVRFEQNLTLNSNAREAYLRTWGWSHSVSIWYFYFRRVEYPADPEINGSWEWAGIYFGDFS